MIYEITKKEYKKRKSLKKCSSAMVKGYQFIGKDNKAYVCDTVGWMGVLEIQNFQKELNKKVTKSDQTTMF